MLSPDVQACNRQNMYCVPLYDSLGEVKRLLCCACWHAPHGAAGMLPHGRLACGQAQSFCSPRIPRDPALPPPPCTVQHAIEYIIKHSEVRQCRYRCSAFVSTGSSAGCLNLAHICCMCSLTLVPC